MPPDNVSPLCDLLHIFVRDYDPMNVMRTSDKYFPLPTQNYATDFIELLFLLAEWP
jgi:hypothetical protein